MAITCTCPKCGRFCGFKEAYAGRCARCLACNSRFIIPGQSGQKAELADVTPLEPLEGFYQKVFKGTMTAFIHKESLFGIILCIALTGFHFAVGDIDYSFTVGGFRPPLIVGWVATFICAGYLLWYFMETVNITIMENDILPDIFIGSGFTFIGEAIKSIYLFVAAFAVAAIPGAAVTALLEQFGVSITWLNILIILLSMTTLPMMLGMIGSGVPLWKLFRYDLIVRVILKAFKPYLLTLVITSLAVAAIYMTVGFFSTTPGVTKPHAVLMVIGRLAAVFLMIFAMRTIGLFALHYYPCFPFLTQTPSRDN
jgi:hypothetical protein